MLLAAACEWGQKRRGKRAKKNPNQEGVLASCGDMLLSNGQITRELICEKNTSMIFFFRPIF